MATVKAEDIAVCKAYMAYIGHLDKKMQKELLKDYLRRHVQDVRFDPFVSEAALRLMQTGKTRIKAEELENIKFPFKTPGNALPKDIKHLFISSNRSKPYDKTYHFEHNIPAAQAADILLEIDTCARDADKKIEEALKNCTLCIITVEENDKLNGKGWANDRPPDAYKQLGINLKSHKQAVKILKDEA